MLQNLVSKNTGKINLTGIYLYKKYMDRSDTSQYEVDSHDDSRMLLTGIVIWMGVFGMIWLLDL